MSVTCYLNGRMGNCILELAHLISYATKHGLTYYVPTQALAYRKFRNGDISVPFKVESTGEQPKNPFEYHEPNASKGNPSFHHIPKMDNVSFRGYYQSFLYSKGYREQVLKAFNFPYEYRDIVSISVRRGDCVNSPNFPIAPKCYYQNAISYMQQRAHNKFIVHSDDMNWCRAHFKSEEFNGAEFEFSTSTNEYDDFCSLIGCAHNITARSTFSLTAAWINQNTEKIVCVPTTKFLWWRGQNLDLLRGFDEAIQIDFETPTDEWSI